MEDPPSSEVKVVGEYEESTWVEMQEDEGDDINCLGMFDDPGERPVDQCTAHLFIQRRLHLVQPQTANVLVTHRCILMLSIL